MRSLRIVLGCLCVLIGAVFLPTPLPGTTALILFGLILINEKWVAEKVKKWPWIQKIHERLVNKKNRE